MDTVIETGYGEASGAVCGNLARHWLACSGLLQRGEGVSPLLEMASLPEVLQGRDRDSDSLTFNCSACSVFPHT